MPAMQYGGPIPVVYELSKKLIAKGHTITVATTTANGATDFEESGEYPINYEGINVHYFQRIKFERLFSFLSYFRDSVGFFYAPSLKKYLKENILEYDIIHLHEFFSYPAIMTGRIANRKQVKYVIHLHGMLDSYRMARRNLKKKIYFGIIGKKFFNQADGIIAFTKSERNDLERLDLVTPTATIPNGINPTQIKYVAIKKHEDYFGFENKKVVLYLGRIHPIKGIDLLISAFSKIVIKNKEALLAIVLPNEKLFTRMTLDFIYLPFDERSNFPPK